MSFKINKITPILNVSNIESSLPFWEKSLGYEVIVKVPDNGEMLDFAILNKGESEVMLQTIKSIEEDLHGHTNIAKADILLYADVDSIDEVEKSIKKENILIPRRTTFYGAIEIWAQDDCGKIIGFAQK